MGAICYLGGILPHIWQEAAAVGLEIGERVPPSSAADGHKVTRKRAEAERDGGRGAVATTDNTNAPLKLHHIDPLSAPI